MTKEIEQLKTIHGAKYKRITLVDERWYIKDDQLSPSVTWICDSYPKGIGFYKWIGMHGWDEAEALKKAAGDKGTKVHKACEDIVKGQTVKMSDKYFSKETEKLEELTLEEWIAIVSFRDWLDVMMEKYPDFLIVASEVAVWNPGSLTAATDGKYDSYAGTVDLVFYANKKLWVLDLKTSQQVWPSAEMQVSAYAPALVASGIVKRVDGRGILQLGYRLNKRSWKFNEIQDKYDLFESAIAIWWNENATKSPREYELPVQIAVKVKWAKKEKKQTAPTKKKAPAKKAPGIPVKKVENKNTKKK